MNQFWKYFWNSKWLLILSAGILLGLSYPPIPLPILVIPAFLIVFRLVELSDSARQAAYYTYPVFLIWNIITTYWLMMATLAGGIAAILANSAVMTVPVMLQYKIQQKDLKPWIIALLQTAFWLAYEYGHHHWDLAWPWLTVANAWANATGIVQYISITGYWGISFWVILSTVLFYQALRTGNRFSRNLSILVFLFFPIWSLSIQLFGEKPNPVDHQQVVVVQPNFDSYEPRGGFSSYQEATDHLLALVDSVRTDSTRLVVWPENAIQTQISNSASFSPYSTNTKIQLSRKANNWNSTIITGATFFEYYDDNRAPRLTYPSKNRTYLPYNAALGFYPNGNHDIYRKHNLVPVVERVPFVVFLDAIDIFNWFDWRRSQGYGKGYQPDQFTVGKTKTPALICYDSVFPGWTRTFVNNGAGYLTIITNDGWWGETSGHIQHFAYARLRAIETGRWIVRSANNGISGIIAPDGSIKKKTPYWVQTSFPYDVPVRDSQTFYVSFGDWLPALMVILSAIGIGLIFYRRSPY